MEAGSIAARVRAEAREFVMVGKKYVDVCDFVEKRIHDLGGEPAFPFNLDVDRVAAHYTSPQGDTSVIQNGALIKMDIGVHVDGYIADTATTICFDPSLIGLVEAAEAGLETALKTVKAGVRASDIGAAIERAILGKGAAPIRNLTGHRLARFVVHAGQSIPNISGTNGHILKEGEVYAIEPFAVPPNAAGVVIDGPPGHIYVFRKKRKLGGELAKRMMKYIRSKHRTLPFASRWLLRKFPGSSGEDAFSQLVTSKCVYSYPQLVERSRSPVAQAEHTIIVTRDGCIVTTA
jgi:methionyl aminopeptidase